MSGRLAVDRITTAGDLHALRGEWEALLRDCPGHALAVTPTWMLNWWDVYGAGRELCVLTARHEGRLVGIAPLLLRTVRHRGMLPFRRVEFLAAGEAQEHLVDSDYLDFIVHPAWEETATRQLCGALFEGLRERWDEIHLAHLPGESPRLPRVAAAAAQAGMKCEEAERRPGVFLTLPATWEELLAGLKSERRKQLGRRRRRLAEAGRVDFSWEVTPETFEARWAAVVELHQRRWQAAGSAGCFASEKFTAFHRRVAAELLPRGGLRLAILSLDGRPLACDYYFAYDGRIYAYQAGYDPELAPPLSAGTLCISYGIEAAIREGFREYDLLKNVHSYKADWSSERRDQVTLRVAQAGAREHLRATLETGIRLTRPFRRRLAGGPV